MGDADVEKLLKLDLRGFVKLSLCKFVRVIDVIAGNYITEKGVQLLLQT